jgi:thioredoxin-like negative regulator of GroEL
MYDGVDDEQEIIAELKVIETPTVLFFKDCSEVYRQTGAMSETQFKDLVTKYAI